MASERKTEKIGSRIAHPCADQCHQHGIKTDPQAEKIPQIDKTGRGKGDQDGKAEDEAHPLRLHIPVMAQQGAEQNESKKKADGRQRPLEHPGFEKRNGGSEAHREIGDRGVALSRSGKQLVESEHDDSRHNGV